MPPTSADILVYTFKAGLLSRVAHDLKLRTGTVDLKHDEQGILKSVTVDASTLRVVCAMRKGREDHRALSAANRAEIEDNIRDKVLHADRHPVIRFEVDRTDADQVHGRLTLHGRTRPLRLQQTRTADGWTTRFRLDQRDYGIQPFSAAMGTLRIEPTIEVVARLHR